MACEVHSELDPWGPDFAEEPFAFYERLREAAPVVKLDRYHIWSVSRFDMVHQVLNDHVTFCSSGGAGLSNFHKERPWRVPNLILESDPPLHTRVRGVLARVLSPAMLKQLRTAFRQEAEKVIAPLVARGKFDAMTEVVEPYLFKVFPEAIGLDKEGRENLVLYGNMSFAALGPRNAMFNEAMSHAPKVLPYIAEKCQRHSLAPEGLGAKIYEATDSGELTFDEAGGLIRALLSAGIDTTVNGIGQAIHCLAQHPEQWAMLRNDPALARAAFDEALRYDSPTPFVFRTTTQAIAFLGTEIPPHEKVLVFLGSANRDPARWDGPDVFDIRRRSVGHLSFGGGIHACIGQMVARLEAESVLETLAAMVDKISIAGPVRRRVSSALRGLSSLPVEVVAR